MSLLNDVINGALRDHNMSPQAAGGSSPIMDALRSLLTPKSAATGAPPDQTHPESDALQQILARFEQSGYADIIRSWIGTGANKAIEPQQLNEALGAGKVDELSRQTGLPHGTLLEELARLLPTVIDKLTPQGRLPQQAHSQGQS